VKCNAKVNNVWGKYAQSPYKLHDMVFRHLDIKISDFIILLCAAVLNYNYLHILLWNYICHSEATLQNTQILT
jgi:hypothetical protein